MFVDQLPVNYKAILLAAIAYYTLGTIWYAPFMFGHRSIRHNIDEPPSDFFQKYDIYHIGSYVGEFIISLIIAYVLNFFIQMRMPESRAEGILVAIWAWIGFIATTHFSAVLWTRKTVKSFFVHGSFMLLGLVVMAIILMFFER